MSLTNGTRTLIRGKRRIHPYMFEPSHSLFRVDRIHHLFSLVIAMKPSPDWFLGVTRFELCTELGWLDEHELPLYPWDAGTLDGISYEVLTKSFNFEILIYVCIFWISSKVVHMLRLYSHAN